tara:strand:- start:441 stop:1685 length:1245 start_codon:yes stop_codon:yes gene_type:complete
MLGVKELQQLRVEHLAGNKNAWNDPMFHLRNRVTTLDELIEIFPDINIEVVKDQIEQGYQLSLMPLTVLLSLEHPEVRNKFIPKADFFEREKQDVSKDDPYGIFESEKVEVDGIHVGSQKFRRSLLMNITSSCPIGCVSCYKGEYTRVSEAGFFTDLGKTSTIQTKKLVEYLNDNPEIASVIMSGGEPLLLGNQGMKKVLEKLREAQYLAEFRICTGTLFQGWPFRLDSEWLEVLRDYESETGVRVHLNAHLSHPAQFTPEALDAVARIREYGFPINSQVPLQEGVNVFREDFDKTMQTLYELAELQGRNGVRPYKYILHMNSGSLEYSVPLEFMLQILGELKYKTDHHLPETWQPVSVSILCKEGNILLSPQLALCLEKEVFAEYVEYRIPIPHQRGFRDVTYREPKMEGFND